MFIDIELIGNRTAAVAEYLYYPFVVLSVLALSMTQLFDDWVFSWNRAGLYAYYAAVIGFLWLALHTSAIRARDTAASELKESWIRMQNPQGPGGQASDAAHSQFKLLRKGIQDTTAGAYGSLCWVSPFFRAHPAALGQREHRECSWRNFSATLIQALRNRAGRSRAAADCRAPAAVQLRYLWAVQESARPP